MHKLSLPVLPVLLVLLLLPSVSYAQLPGVTGYEVRFYDFNAASPRQVEQFPADAATCNQAPSSPNASTVNPTKFEFDDAAATGRVCHIFEVLNTGALFSVPIGQQFQATILQRNAAGLSGESNRAPFSRLAPPPGVTGFRVVNPGP